MRKALNNNSYPYAFRTDQTADLLLNLAARKRGLDDEAQGIGNGDNVTPTRFHQESRSIIPFDN